MSGAIKTEEDLLAFGDHYTEVTRGTGLTDERVAAALGMDISAVNRTYGCYLRHKLRVGKDPCGGDLPCPGYKHCLKHYRRNNND